MKKETSLKVYALKKNETEFKNTQITSSESAARPAAVAQCGGRPGLRATDAALCTKDA